MFSRMRNAFGAWRRGERRIAPHGTRGRVYVKKNPEEESSPGSHNSAATPLAVLEMKITRADGTVETVQVPATAEILPSE